MLKRPTRVGLTTLLVALFVPLVCGTGLLVSSLGVRRTEEVLAMATEQSLETLAMDLRNRIRSALDPGLVTVELERLQDLAGGRSTAQRLALLPQLTLALSSSRTVAAFLVASPDGSLFVVANAHWPSGPLLNDLPDKAAYVVQTRQAGARRAHLLVFDDRLRQLSSRDIPLRADFNLRQLPWVARTVGATQPVLSPAHRFTLVDHIGVTASLPMQGGGAVAAALPLGALGRMLEEERFTPHTELAIVTPTGSVIATPGMQGMGAAHSHARGDAVLPTLSQLGLPALAALAPQLALERQGADPMTNVPALSRYRLHHQPWRGAVIGLPSAIEGGSTFLLVAIPEAELLAGSRRLAHEGGVLTLLVLLLAVPVVVLLARRLSQSLRRLAADAHAIRSFQLAGDGAARSHIAEVDELGVTLDAMRGTIRRFLEISSLLAKEEDVDRLLEQLLEESVQVSHACGGSLTLPPDRRLERGTVAGAQALPLPLLSRSGERLGELVLHFAAPPEPARVAFCRSLSGNAAVALETRSLINAQKALFAAFIEMIAAAIDAKSPYTGGHCARVPELAAMLAQAACEARTGPYAAFQLSEPEWEALHIGSWLHDCGKVTTPEYVVDKATKLETLYDRIHEVRMRFELLKSSAETAYWRAVAEGGDAQAALEVLQATWAELDDDFSFVAACNLGGEAMDDADLERLRRIAARPWRRTLDDRLGISNDERRRCTAEPVPDLPCEEPLLADRPRHRIPRPDGHGLAPDNPWGFTMAEPELLADRGELHNLSIRRGTLTDEERYAINQHIIQTIRMLQALPYPAHLQAVPEIAGGHHERIDGKGYPRSLTGEQMSPLARMMAIADVFEALTAADRPYKSGKTLSASLAIMARMVQEQHLDAELFELFVRSGVYRRYAERFLAADQTDVVDEEALLRR